MCGVSVSGSEERGNFKIRCFGVNFLYTVQLKIEKKRKEKPQLSDNLTIYSQSSL